LILLSNLLPDAGIVVLRILGGVVVTLLAVLGGGNLFSGFSALEILEKSVTTDLESIAF
jgi:hypothetical protein